MKIHNRASACASFRSLLLLTTVATLCAGFADVAAAQTTPPGLETASGDIIVTARKKSETAINVPVTISAIGAEELSRRNITTMDAIARSIPALTIGDGGSSGLQGGLVVIRGISGTEANPLSDQAVSFNIDGVQVAKASVRRMGEMDMQQVEVLKGPQALFFGKNSPGGVISIRTADPTQSFEAGGSIGYEINAREANATAYVSGPITSTLGIRFAGMVDTMQGWIKRVAPKGGMIVNGVPTLPTPGIVFSPTTNGTIFGPATSRAPDTRDYAGRLTLKWEPNDKFDARLKITYGTVRGTPGSAGLEVVRCALPTGPQGFPATTPGACSARGLASGGEVGPNIAAKDPLFGNGTTFVRQSQVVAGLEMNYHVQPDLTLTSMTSYYESDAQQSANFNSQYLETGTGASRILGSAYKGSIRELTEEVRLASSFNGPFNFTVGGLIQDSKNDAEIVSAFNALNPAFLNHYKYVQDGTAWSLFAQAQVDFLDHFQLSAGGRYSHETKKLPVALNATSFASGFFNTTGPDFVRERSYHDFSPEIMLSYRPTRDINIYGGYKEGFLSGGFNAVAAPAMVAAGVRSDYNQQVSKGFEGGIKASLLNQTLRTNIAFYTYKITGLQVGVSINNNTAIIVSNAASVRNKGMEFDLNWRAPIEGLSVSGALAYTDAKYINYLAQCYTGQTNTLCFGRAQLNGGNGQDLTGQELARAPKWTGNMGVNYEFPVSAGLKAGFSGNWTYSDSYFTDSINSPLSRHPSYGLFDATARVAEIDGKWELALIGRNLTNKHTYIRGSGVPFTGSGTATASGVLGDFQATIDRGRQVMVRLSFKLGQ